MFQIYNLMITVLLKLLNFSAKISWNYNVAVMYEKRLLAHV